MSDKPVRIGFDRYIAKDWANYAFELTLSPGDEAEKYQSLKDFLHIHIQGEESHRKTANQLKRLWLNTTDEFGLLRAAASEITWSYPVTDYSVFHLGMALNAFPVFRETCRRMGELARVQETFSTNLVIDRVTQAYGNPTSIPRIVTRVIQTLEDWQFVQNQAGVYSIRRINITEPVITCWIINALMSATEKNEIALRSIHLVPEALGINFPEIRDQIQKSDCLDIKRSRNGEEVIVSLPNIRSLEK